MPGNAISLTSPPGILGEAVLIITLVFAVMAIASLLPRRTRGPRA